MITLPDNLKRPFADLLLAVADDKLMLGHRNSDWTGLAPILEEDIAFSSLAQDEMAHAQALYQLIAGLIGTSADALAFGRKSEAFRCAAIVEAPDEFDWATAICRQFFCDHFDRLRLRRLARSSDKPVADLANRLAAEEQIHVEHVDSWMQRLGRGTDESRQRMQRSLDALAAIAPSLFETIEHEHELVAADVYPRAEKDMFETWRNELEQIANDSSLKLDLHPPSPQAIGGRRGKHTEHLAPLLHEMCEVYRLEPNAAW